MKPKPLQKRTMSLDELQRRTLKVLELCRRQFHRAAHEEGLSDSEFIEAHLLPLSHDIKQDRLMLKMLKARQ